MLFFLISFLSFLLLSKTLSLKPLPSWASEMRLLFFLFCQEFLFHLVHWVKNGRLITSHMLGILPKKSVKNKVVSKFEKMEESDESLILDLPDLALECILGRLSPDGLCNMAATCISLRDICRSDRLWERHMREKWAPVIGRTALRKWQCYTASRKDTLGVASGRSKPKGWIESLSCLWPLSWLNSKINDGGKARSSLLTNSIMSLYQALESGKFWFPAQVYNREHGHVGFMLSCYDAELSYDRRTDTFHARYPPHGRRTVVIEEGVQWNRLRAPVVDTPAHDLHVSDCLNDLRPGNHIEIQWRRNKEFPYGWWYGVVSHLETCGGSAYHCRCCDSDTVVLEFNQYSPGSRWRRTTIKRKDHREEGNETDGFYGGIRKLENKVEISEWRRLWPTEHLE